MKATKSYVFRTINTEAKGWGKKNEDLRRSVVCHVQWCGLARGHAQRIVEFPELDRFLDIGNRMSKACCPDEWVLGTILSLQLRGEGRNRESRQGKEDEDEDQEEEEKEEEEKGKEETDPEEVGRNPTASAATATVTATVPPGVTDWPVTDQYRAKRQAQSPLVWNDLDTTIHKVLWAPPQTYRSFTLEKVVEQVSRNEGNLFFRKVGPLTEEETDRLIPLTKAKEVPDAATTNADITAVMIKKGEMASTVGKGSSSSSAATDSEDVDDEASSSRNSSSVPATPQTHTKLPEQEEEEEEEKVVASRAAAVPIYGHRVRDRRRRRGCPEGGGGGGCCEECG